MATKKKPDWKKIAHALAQRVNLAITYLHAPGDTHANGGLLFNINNGKSQHWKDYMADGMEMLPGVTVNREIMHMTRAQRRKAKPKSPPQSPSGSEKP